MITQIDFRILDFSEEFIKCPVLDIFFSIFTFLGNKGLIMILTALIFLFFRKTRKIGIVILMSLIIGLAFGNGILKNIVARARPYDIDAVLKNNIIIPIPTDYSFPSGHSLAAFEWATSIFLFNKKWGMYTLIPAVLIAASRIYLLVHFPTDVLAGAFFGIVNAIIGYLIYKRFFENKFEKYGI